MIDELREEEIIKKVGGRFKLSTLIQKRLVQLNAGSRPLIDAKNDAAAAWYESYGAASLLDTPRALVFPFAIALKALKQGN